ncbi:hypothetical protein [Streptomyces sp. NPDC005865]
MLKEREGGCGTDDSLTITVTDGQGNRIQATLLTNLTASAREQRRPR